MTEAITITQLLDLLVKAYKVTAPLGRISFKKVHGGYEIGINCDWDYENTFYTHTTFISEEGHSTWEISDYEFFTIGMVLDEVVKEKEEREMKREKRKELLSRLTDEEKELLGVES